jgi:hypothetical protein
MVSGWTGFGILMLVLSLISIVTGLWDICNLPPTAKQTQLSDPNPKLVRQNDLPSSRFSSITEQTTQASEQKNNVASTQ